jgi:glycosyltransferase involved in cell wall biosynthesis
MPSLKMSVIIPAFNEAQTIGPIVEKIKAHYPDCEVIVVDDGSTDDTGSVAGRAGAIVHRHPYNIGNGAAVKSGIRAASGEILVLMDGDGQHDPSDIHEMLRHFPAYDMVVGARPFRRQASVGRAFGNTIYNRFSSYVAKFPIQDLTSGFRAVKSDIARQLLYLLPNTYSYPTTLTLGVLRNGRSLKYIPISNRQRSAGKSNIRSFRDGVRFFMIITKICVLYSPLRVFLPVSFVMFLLGLFYYAYTYLAEGRFTNMGAVLLTTAVLVFMMGLVSEQICQMRFDKSEDHRIL